MSNIAFSLILSIFRFTKPISGAFLPRNYRSMDFFFGKLYIAGDESLDSDDELDLCPQPLSYGLYKRCPAK